MIGWEPSCQVPWKKVIHDVYVFGKPFPNSSVWIGVEKNALLYAALLSTSCREDISLEFEAIQKKWNQQSIAKIIVAPAKAATISNLLSKYTDYQDCHRISAQIMIQFWTSNKRLNKWG